MTIDRDDAGNCTSNTLESDDIDDYNHALKGSKPLNDKNILLAAVVVILAISIAVSGWILLSAMDKIDPDPFIEERAYLVQGTMLIDGQEKECTGNITARYSSDTETYEIFTYTASYGDGNIVRTAKFSLMFDSQRVPCDLYTHIGQIGGYEVWKGTDMGVDALFFLNVDDIVQKIEFTNGSDKLIATLSG